MVNPNGIIYPLPDNNLGGHRCVWVLHAKTTTKNANTKTPSSLRILVLLGRTPGPFFCFVNLSTIDAIEERGCGSGYSATGNSTWDRSAIGWSLPTGATGCNPSLGYSRAEPVWCTEIAVTEYQGLQREVSLGRARCSIKFCCVLNNIIYKQNVLDRTLLRSAECP